MRGERAWTLLLFAVAALLLFAGLGRSDLYNPDEPREAEMAREMLEGGDLLVPRLNGEPFLEKPPLFYWLVISAYRLAGGPGEAAARAVPAVSGFLCLLVTFWMARALLGPLAALLSTAILLTAFEFFWISHRCMIDMPLTLCVLLACALLYRGIVLGGERRRLWLTLGYAATAAAVLMKGIVGAGIPALAAAAWIATRFDRRSIWRHGLIPGALAALVPVGLWAERLHARLGTEAVREFVLVNNVLRFTGGASKGHDNPLYYYLPTLAVDLAPWSLLLPFALLAAIRSIRRAGPERDLLLWFMVPFVVLSLASTKRGIYLLPLYPPAAMLIAAWLTREEEGRSRRLAGALLLGGAILLSAVALLALRIARPSDFLTPVALALLLLIPGVAAYRAWRRRRLPRMTLCIACLSAILLLCLMTVLLPAVVNSGTSARAAGADLRQMSEAGDRIAFYQLKQGNVGGFLFYSGRLFPNLADKEALARHLEAAPADPAEPRPFALLRARALAGARAGLPFEVQEARRFRQQVAPWEDAGSNDYVLITRAF